MVISNTIRHSARRVLSERNTRTKTSYMNLLDAGT